MRIGRLILACSLTTASGLLLSTSGQTASTISLKPEHANTTAWAFSKKSCDGFPDILSTLDGWHFVLPKSVNARFISITLNFNPGNLVVGPITSTSRQAPTPGRGWTGYLASPGDNFQHAYVKVPAGLTLAGGTAQVDPSVAHGNFQINDVCARPSAPPRAQPPSASQAASAQASSGGASPSEGGASPSQGGASPSEGKASPSKDKQRNASPSQSQGERSKSPLAKATASALESLKARSQAPSGEPSKPESSAKASSSSQARTATGAPTAPASKAASSSAAPRLPGSPPVAPGGPEVGGGPQTLAVPRLPALEGNLFAPPGGPGMAPAGGAETGGGGSQSTAFGPGTMALIAVGALVAFVLRRRENVA